MYEDISSMMNDKLNFENMGLSKLNCFKELRCNELNGING